MNLAWVIPESGPPAARNLHAKDRARLGREGYLRYRLEWTGDDRKARTADVYALRAPTTEELVAGADAIYAARGRGSVRLIDAAGATVARSR